MSFAAHRAVERSGLSVGSSGAVLRVLADFTHKARRNCWPSLATLMEMTGLSRRTVQRALRALERLGAIATVKRRRRNGSQTSNLYRFTLFDAPRTPVGTSRTARAKDTTTDAGVLTSDDGVLPTNEGFPSAHECACLSSGGFATVKNEEPVEKTLWPDQTDAIDRLRGSLKSGKRRPVLMRPTGSGKTVVATKIIENALTKGKRVGFVVPAIDLIDQSAVAFYEEGIRDLGVIQADHPMTNWKHPVQVCSVQTLQRCRVLPHFDLVLVDECHRLFKFYENWFARWGLIPFVGLSATPWQKGMAKLYDDLIVSTTTAQLIKEGRLSPFQVYAPSLPDLSKAKVKRGDYADADAAKAMAPLTGDIVSTWLLRGKGRPTLCFCVDRAHAKHVMQQFDLYNVRVAYQDCFTPADERKRIADRFRRGDLEVVCNVGTLTTGVDWDVRCIILARPTKSEILYVQIVGRGLRTAPGKDYCLILDHSRTTLDLGFVTDIHHNFLDDNDLKWRQPAEKLPKLCGQCACVMPPNARECPQCGYKMVHKARDQATADGELKKLDPVTRRNKEDSWETKIAFMGELKCWAEHYGHGEGWVAHKYRARYGVWPNDSRVRDAPVARSISMATRSWVKAQNIRRAKALQKVEQKHVA